MSCENDCKGFITHSTVAGNGGNQPITVWAPGARVTFTSSLILGDCGYTTLSPFSNGHNLESPGDTCFPAGAVEVGETLTLLDVPAVGPADLLLLVSLVAVAGPLFLHRRG